MVFEYHGSVCIKVCYDAVRVKAFTASIMHLAYQRVHLRTAPQSTFHRALFFAAQAVKQASIDRLAPCKRSPFHFNTAYM